MSDLPLSEMSPTQYLRVRRVALGLSQKELAERVGTTQSVIAALENGRRTLTPSMEAKLRHALRENPAELLRRHRDRVLEAAAEFGFTNVRVFGSVAR